MEIFRRFAKNEDGIFGFEKLSEKEAENYSNFFLPYPMHETQLHNFLSIWLYAERIAENFGEIVDDDKSKCCSIIRKEFRNDKIIISSEHKMNAYLFHDTYFGEIKISNSKGETQIHASRRIYDHDDIIRIYLDKTNERYNGDLYYKLSDLDAYLSNRAGIPSLYELTHTDTSEFPKNFF